MIQLIAIAYIIIAVILFFAMKFLSKTNGVKINIFSKPIEIEINLPAGLTEKERDTLMIIIAISWPISLIKSIAK